MPSWKRVIVSGSSAALNSLTVTSGITGSLFGTASYALTSSYGVNATISGSLYVEGTVAVSSSIFRYSNNTAILSGSTANIASFPTNSYTAGFFDYIATSGTNARAGVVYTVWNGSSIEYTETSTNDIGNTSNLLLSASISAGAIRLQGTSLSGSWSVKTLARMI